MIALILASSALKWAVGAVVAILGVLGYGWRQRSVGAADARGKAKLDQAADRAKQQEAINHADTGVGATDIERIIRLRKFENRK